MATTTLKPIRQHTKVTLPTTLTDNSVQLNWADFDSIKAFILAEEQHIIAGPCELQIRLDEPTILECTYGANRAQHLGIQKLVVVVEMAGQTSTYDKRAFQFVATTDETLDDGTTVEEETAEVDINVLDVSSSALNGAIAAALAAAEKADAAAGHGPYIGDNGHWFVWDHTENDYVDTETPAQGASVYELAVEHGYEGTEAEYLALYTDAISAANAAATAAQTASGNAQSAAESAWAAQEEAQNAAIEASNAASDASMAAGAANEAAQDANEAADSASTAAAAANQAADEAETAAGSANAAADAALDAAAAVEGAAEAAEAAAAAAAEAASGASDAAAAAAEAASGASDAGDYAKEQGDYAKEQVDGAKGNYDSLDERFDATEATAIHLDPSTDPSDAEYQDEYQRVLRVLYQAINDVLALKQMTADATDDARTAAQASTVATAEALRAAAYALEQAALASNAAAAAAEAADIAKGDYPTLNARLEAIESDKQDKIQDLDDIREGAEAGASAYKLPEAGIPKTDLEPDVQDSLALADAGLHYELSTDPSSLLDD